MKKPPGLPKDLENETVETLRTIYWKYFSMKKKHMSMYRIIGIMGTAFTQMEWTKEKDHE